MTILNNPKPPAGALSGEGEVIISDAVRIA